MNIATKSQNRRDNRWSHAAALRIARQLAVLLVLALIVSTEPVQAQPQSIDTLCGGEVVIPEGFPTPPPVNSQIVVGGLAGVIANIGVYLTDFNAPRPDDLDLLLVHPNGTSNLEFWSDAGGTSSTNLTGSNVNVDDSGGGALPDDGPLVGGSTYQPSDYGVVGTDPTAFGLAPAFVINHPAPNASATFQSEFGGLAPNGTWDLYGVDDTGTVGGPTASFLDWCLVITTQEGALPVEFTSFRVIASDRDAVLTWATASETNNAGFEIQHALGDEFEAIEFVDGAGTTTEPLEYRYVAEDLAPGLHRFRLKQVDFDGSFEYSQIVETQIELPGGYEVSSLYPNPTRAESEFTVTVGETQDVRISIYDVTGRSVREIHDGTLSQDQVHRFSFEAGSLPGGAYFVRVIGRTFAETKRVMLAR